MKLRKNCTMNPHHRECVLEYDFIFDTRINNYLELDRIDALLNYSQIAY